MYVVSNNVLLRVVFALNRMYCHDVKSIAIVAIEMRRG